MRRTYALAGTLAALVAAGVVLFDTAQPSAAQHKADPPAVHATSSPSPRVSTSPATSAPPECNLVQIENNSGTGPAMFVKFCGTGSAGDSPVMDKAAQLIVDGTTLRPVNCTKANPCIVVWPASPVDTAGK